MLVVATAKTLTSAEIAFYSTAATVIPVLLLALALEVSAPHIVKHVLGLRGRLGRRAVRAIWWSTFAVAVLMTTAELTALSALLNDHAGHDADGWVMVGLVTGTIIAFLGVLLHAVDQTVDAAKDDAA